MRRRKSSICSSANSTWHGRTAVPVSTVVLMANLPVLDRPRTSTLRLHTRLGKPESRTVTSRLWRGLSSPSWLAWRDPDGGSGRSRLDRPLAPRAEEVQDHDLDCAGDG